MKHLIALTPQGIKITIWEPAQMTKERVKPFLYQINHLVENWEQAQNLLSEYGLSLN